MMNNVTIKNAATDNELMAAKAAVKAHREKFGTNGKLGKGFLYSLLIAGNVLCVEVRNQQKNTIAEVRKGHRKLTKVWG